MDKGFAKNMPISGRSVFIDISNSIKRINYKKVFFWGGGGGDGYKNV